MRKIEVRAEHSYRVALCADWQQELIELVSSRSRVAIISSEGFPVKVSLSNAFHYYIPDGEAGKNHEVVARLWSELHRDGFTRSDIVVGIGGGAVTDFSGFVAATYLRGLDWIAIPTTLAGMVDAAVGGKTGINMEAGKNLVGAFHSPVSVIVDLQWLTTLSDRDFAAGLAEILKCGFIMDASIANDLGKTNLASIRADSKFTQSLIDRAISVKATVVSSDFKESSLREILNYGHTFGHAIEGYSHFRLRHGEAVAIGMVFAAELSASRGLIDSSLVDLHRTTLKGLGLPTSLDSSFTVDAWPQLLQEMRSDKKARGTQIRFVAVTALGETSRLDDVNEEELRTIYEKVLP